MGPRIDELEIGPDDLPHRAPARLVVRVLDRDGTSIVCEGRIPPDSPFVTDARCPTFLGLELAAQAAAVLDRAGGSPADAAHVGYLVRVRSTRFVRPEFSSDATLVTRVRRGAAHPPLIAYSAWVGDDLGELLSGEFATWVTP